jgi:two-component system chemotaxis response regulator CheB
MARQLRVMVVDDSALYRTLLADAVNASGGARVVTHAGDGLEALRKAAEYTPDLVTVDVEMPGMSGLELLQALRKEYPRLPIIVVSAHTTQGARESVRALELGASDVVAKPDGNDANANREELRTTLGRLLHAFMPQRAPTQSVLPPRPTGAAPTPQIVAIGASTGGPAALATILPKLPKGLPVPVIVVQHMPPLFTASLAESLASKCALRVVEAKAGDALVAGTIFIAPGGKHLGIATATNAAGTRTLELTDDPPENHCRPAVDFTMRAVAQAYRDRAMGVILTGMGKDGTLGLRVMKRHGVYVVGQSAESCTVYGMPREAMAAGVVDVELPAEQIAQAIVTAVTTGRRT